MVSSPCPATNSVYEHEQNSLSSFQYFLSTSVSGNVLGVVNLVMQSIF